MTDLTDMLAAPEGRTLEFKRDLSSLRRVMQTLVAFANTAGGTLVIGRDDDGTVRGVSDPQSEEERLASAISDNIVPGLFPDIEVVSSGGVELLVVRVARWPGPFHLAADGPERGVYVRLGSTNRQADAATLAELKREAEQLAFDQHPCVGADLGDLDIELTRRLFAAQGREIDEAKLESLGVLIRYGSELVPSNGGVILFGRAEARQQRFPDAQVRCARFKGTGKADFLDQLDIETSVLGAVDEAARFVRRNTRLAAKIESLHRKDVPEYPLLALREALVNAVAHTDYQLTGMNIRVAVFDDRLEIESPGTLPFGLTIEDLKAGVSRIRNPVIARVLRELTLMETWGSGYRRIREDCAALGHPLPDWVELGSVVRCVFSPHPEVVAVSGAGATDVPANVPASVPANVPAGTELSERQQWFMEQVAKGAPVRPKHLADKFGVSEKTAKRDIGALTEFGIVEFVGPTKTGRYRATDKPDDDTH
jgi:ATP-dependent DNA helicase RecG